MPKQRSYGRQRYEIEFTGDSLEAGCHRLFGPKGNRLLLGLLFILLAVWGIYGTWLSQTPYGHGNWWYLAHDYHALDSGADSFARVFYVLFLLMGIRLLCPAGAIQISNRSQVTHTYDAIDVSGFRRKYFGSGRGGDVYGIRFFVNGSKKTIFHGSIAPPVAYRILLRLETLGLDGVADPKLHSPVKLGLLGRKEEELDRGMGI